MFKMQVILNWFTQL